MHTNFDHVVIEIRHIATEWEKILSSLPEEKISNPVNRQGRSIKMIVGHMIDAASNHHQRMVRMQYTSHLVFPDFTSQNDMWISIQQHRDEDWDEMVQLWKYYNLHIAHIIDHADQSWMNNIWTDGKQEPVTLKEMILEYMAHLALHMKEISLLMGPGIRGSSLFPGNAPTHKNASP